MREEFTGRVARVQEHMARRGLVGLYLPLGPNFTYLSGVSLAPTSHAATRVFAAVIPVEGPPGLVVPARRRAFVQRNTWIEDISTWAFPDSPWQAVAEALRRRNLTRERIGVDTRTSWHDCTSIRAELPGLEFVDASALLAEVRLTKTPWELAQMEKAGLVAGRAVAQGLAAVRGGIEETDLAAEIFRVLLAEGADVFQVAVISGLHRGFPERSERKTIQPGDPIMLFPKFQFGGYYVDITRMAVVGPLSPEQARIEHALLESRKAAMVAAGPGVPFRAVDQAARRRLEQDGLAKYLTHGIGHGVGLETHESPYVDDEMALQPGMIFTIEPSVYFPNGPAYRIEDTFAVTDHGTWHLTPLNPAFHQAV